MTVANARKLTQINQLSTIVSRRRGDDGDGDEAAADESNDDPAGAEYEAIRWTANGNIEYTTINKKQQIAAKTICDKRGFKRTEVNKQR